MKKTTLCFALLAVVLLSCNGNVPEPDNTGSKIDETLDKHENISEAETVKNSYDIFYKPINGVTGDPMPFYHEEEQIFYVYFLLGRFSGYPGGGVYLTKTKDFTQFMPAKSPMPQILTGPQNTYDENIGTGSCIKRGNMYHFFYTAFQYPSSATKATFSGTNLNNAQWIKQPTLQVKAPYFCQKGEFRDPHVYWDDTRGKYVMAVAGHSNDGHGIIVRFQSDDLDAWEEIPPILNAENQNNPQIYEYSSDTYIPECPDIFKMGDKWYLVFSRLNRDNHRKVFYRVADKPDGPWRICTDENGQHETFDGLWLYAAKTVSDGTNRYILGWASVGQDKQPGINELIWGGNLVTHKLVQQPSGKLYPAIPDAIDAKFSKSVEYKVIKQTGGIVESDNIFTLGNGDKIVFNRNIPNLKIEMRIDASQAEKGFGIAFGAYEEQQDSYKLTFDMSKNNAYGCPALFMYHAGKEYNFTPLIVPNNKQFDVKIIIEKQLCVMYINNNVAFTNHISNMERNPWAIFADQGTIKVSNISIKKIP